MKEYIPKLKKHNKIGHAWDGTLATKLNTTST